MATWEEIKQQMMTADPNLAQESQDASCLSAPEETAPVPQDQPEIASANIRPASTKQNNSLQILMICIGAAMVIFSATFFLMGLGQ